MADQQLRDLDLVAMTSHEMRTPLAAIRGFVDTLRRRRSTMDEEQVDEFLEVIASQTDRLTRLVDDLLVLAGLEAGGIVVTPEPVLLVPFLETLIRDEPGGDRVRLSVSAEAPATIETDPLRLHQIVANLLANALKYSSQDRTVSLVAVADGDDVILDVADSGPGIPADDLPRIFEPYYRTAGGRAAADGAGLGLSITRRLAEALGGHLTASSVVGEGSVFRVRLPARARVRPS
ncbi:MAG: sensor histidine kinase [Actinomycetota bacterium]